MYHSATPNLKAPFPGTVDVRLQSPANSVSYSSWGTVPTPPPAVRSPPIYPASFGSPPPSCNGIPSLHPSLHPPAHLLAYDIRLPPPPITDIAFKPLLTKTCVSVKDQREFTFNVENLNGVTVQDILNIIFVRLQAPMTRFDVSRLPLEEKASAQDSFHSRTAHDPREYAQGMKSLDRLSGKFRFIGLVPSPNTPGVWEILFA
ncbi:hypothetical protein D9615_006855 [Tricholomella constricta]|uniref:DUF6699 domain-containing protein n=1 Tax=Tricholomella constricta TaxID=117010 RepID=A0A8H5H9F3_9AGAR|nr:hypothetical protein D9615_006855 [Tricholomella constricta]